MLRRAAGVAATFALCALGAGFAGAGCGNDYTSPNASSDSGADAGGPTDLADAVAAGDSAGIPLTTALTIVSIDPSDGAMDVPANVAAHVTFSTAVDPAFDKSAFTLTRGTTAIDVDVALSSDPKVVVMTPKAPLDFVAGRYAIDVGKTVRAQTGETLENAGHAGFTLVDGKWAAAPEIVATATTKRLYDGQIAIDDGGRRVVVYVDSPSDGVTQAILYGSAATFGSAWSQPKSIDVAPNGTTSFSSIQLAVARTRAVVYYDWYDYPNSLPKGSGQSTLDPSGKWSTHEYGTTLGYPSASISLVGADLSASPSALQFVLGRAVIGGSLQVSTSLDVLPSPTAIPPVMNDASQVVTGLSGSGDIFLAVGRNQTPPSLWIYRQSVATGAWDNGTKTSGTGGLQGYALGTDGGKGAIAVWWENFGSQTANDLRASIFDGTTWSPPATLQGSVESSSTPVLAVNAEGDAIVIWESRQNSVVTLFGSARSAGGAFSAPQVLDSGFYDNLVSPNLAIDPSGNGLVVYARIVDQSFSAPRNAVRYTVAKGWSKTLATITPSQTTTGAPTVAFDAKGRAAVAWGDTMNVNVLDFALP